MARDSRIDQLEAHEFPRDAGRHLRTQRGRADEVGLLPPDDPAEARLEGRRFPVDIVAVEPHRRFETERVPGAKSARDEPVGLARRENRLPDAVGRLRRDEDFEAVLAGVTSA